MGKTAENREKFLSKAKQALIEGEIRSNRWKGKDEKEHLSYEILASNVTFLGEKEA